MQNSINFNHPSSHICTLEAYGYSLCFVALANDAPGEEIMEIGFNPDSGYTYIALENGITICSCMGQDVQYLVTKLEDGAESFFDNYTDAEEFLETLNN
jgi:hypothetical protein